MLIKMDVWENTGRQIKCGNFYWGEQVLGKRVIETDELVISGANKVPNVYGFPYDVVKIPYKKSRVRDLETTSETYEKLLRLLGGNGIVEL